MKKLMLFIVILLTVACSGALLSPDSAAAVTRTVTNVLTTPVSEIIPPVPVPAPAPADRAYKTGAAATTAVAAAAYIVCEGCVLLHDILGPDDKPLPDGSDVWVTFDKKAAYRFVSLNGVVMVHVSGNSICYGSTEKIALDGSRCWAWATLPVGN